MRCFMDSTFHCLRGYGGYTCSVGERECVDSRRFKHSNNAGNHQTGLKTQSGGSLPEAMRRVAQAG